MNGDEAPYKIIATNAVSEVSVVRVYDETLDHVAKEHPEFKTLIPSLEHAIHDTIANPTSVHQSNREIYSNSYKFCSTEHRFGGNSLVVAVKVVENSSAHMKTAYFTSSVTGVAIMGGTDD